MSWGSVVDIQFSTKQLRKLCNDAKRMSQKWGAVGSRKLRRRLDDLRAAQTLEALKHLPGRCDELSGKQDGQLSLHLGHPLRLIFEPASNPAPSKPNGGLDWGAVTAVRVLGVVDAYG